MKLNGTVNHKLKKISVHLQYTSHYMDSDDGVSKSAVYSSFRGALLIYLFGNRPALYTLLRLFNVY